jgi:hypothetical protein
MPYKRNIDLMNKSVFPVDSLYVQKKNPKMSGTENVLPAKQTNDEIIDFVAKEMSDTLGVERGSQAE